MFRIVASCLFPGFLFLVLPVFELPNFVRLPWQHFLLCEPGKTSLGELANFVG